MHLRIASVSAPDRDRAVAAAQYAPACDLVEIRLDRLWPGPPGEEEASEDLLALTTVDRPLLATLRPKRQGGAYDGPEDIRINLLLAAAKAGFAAVDLEDDHPQISAIMAPFRERDIILSDHRLPDAPSREEGMRILQSMQDADAAIDKLAFPCGSFADFLRALELAHGHAHRNGRPAIAPLGGGKLVRALLPLAGNHATYGHAGTPAVRDQPALSDIQRVWHHWGLRQDDLPGDPEQGWLAVLGSPVDHSLSPRIHNAMLRHAGRKERFGAMEVPDSIGAMRLIATVAGRIGLRGASVTMPLKHHALAVTAPDEVAQAVGAANCIRFTAAGAESTNTDATAFQRLLEGSEHVAILGAGGAARAAAWAARQIGARFTIISRKAEVGSQLAGEDGGWVAFGDVERVHADAWVQATPAPVGGRMKGVQKAIELVYGDRPTPFEEAAQAAGALAITGRRFLVEQAVDAYRFWTGEDADPRIMEAAL